MQGIASARTDVELTNAIVYLPVLAPVQKLNTKLYNTVLSSLLKLRHYESAFSLLKDMRVRNVPADYITYNTLISGFASTGQWDLVDVVINEMTKMKMPPNSDTYGMLTAMYLKMGRIQQAIETLKQLTSASLVPTPFVHNAIMTYYIKHDLPHKALDWYKNCLQVGKGNSSTLNLAMVAAFKCGKYNEAVSIFRTLCSFIDTDIFNTRSPYSDQAVNKRIAEGGSKDLSEALVMPAAHMIEDLYPDATTFPTFLTHVANSPVGSWDDVTDAVSRAKRLKFGKDRYFYNSLLHACIRFEKQEHVMQVLDEMHEKDVRPDVYTFNIIVDAYAKAGNFNQVWAMLQIMQDSNVAPTIVTFNSIAHAAIKFPGTADILDKVIELMSEHEISCDGYTYSALLVHYVREDDMNSAEKLWRSLKNIDVQISLSVYHTFLLRLLHHKMLSLAAEVAQDMLNGLNLVHPSTTSSSLPTTSNSTTSSSTSTSTKTGALAGTQRGHLRSETKSFPRLAEVIIAAFSKHGNVTLAEQFAKALIDGHLRRQFPSKAAAEGLSTYEGSLTPAINPLIEYYSQVGDYQSARELVDRLWHCANVAKQMNKPADTNGNNDSSSEPGGAGGEGGGGGAGAGAPEEDVAVLHHDPLYQALSPLYGENFVFVNKTDMSSSSNNSNVELEPNERTYRFLIAAYLRAKLVPQAEEVLQEMDRLRVPKTSDVVIPFVQHYNRTKQRAQADEVVANMIASGQVPSSELIVTLASGLFRTEYSRQTLLDAVKTVLKSKRLSVLALGHVMRAVATQRSLTKANAVLMLKIHARSGYSAHSDLRKSLERLHKVASREGGDGATRTQVSQTDSMDGDADCIRELEQEEEESHRRERMAQEQQAEDLDQQEQEQKHSQEQDQALRRGRQEQQQQQEQQQHQHQQETERKAGSEQNPIRQPNQSPLSSSSSSQSKSHSRSQPQPQSQSHSQGSNNPHGKRPRTPPHSRPHSQGGAQGHPRRPLPDTRQATLSEGSQSELPPANASSSSIANSPSSATTVANTTSPRPKHQLQRHKQSKGQDSQQGQTMSRPQQQQQQQQQQRGSRREQRQKAAASKASSPNAGTESLG